MPVSSQDRLHHLGKLLHINPESAAAVSTRMPRLLTIPPKDLQHRISAAAKLLGVSQAQLREVAVVQPGLLVHHTEVLKIRVGCLEKLLGLSAADATKVAAAEPALLTFRYGIVQSVGHLISHLVCDQNVSIISSSHCHLNNA